MSKPRILRPRRNRLTPLGAIEATKARGTMLANRGDLHSEDGTVARLWQRRRWITCELVSLTGERVTFDTLGHYTPLFALDEATALAAGHRPCAECRRPAYDAFVAAWRKAKGLSVDEPVRACEIDDELHAGRIRRGRQITYAARLGHLPEGVFVAMPDESNQPYLLWAKQLWPWSHAGYGRPQAALLDAVITVLTPAPAVEILRAGYRPAVKWPEWVPNRRAVPALPLTAEVPGAQLEASQDLEGVRKGRQRWEAPGAALERPRHGPADGRAEQGQLPLFAVGRGSGKADHGESQGQNDERTPHGGVLRRLDPQAPGELGKRDDLSGATLTPASSRLLDVSAQVAASTGAPGRVATRCNGRPHILPIGGDAPTNALAMPRHLRLQQPAAERREGLMAARTSAVKERVVDAATAIMGDAADDPGFLHVIMSQLGMPLRDPKADRYERSTKRASLLLTAGELYNPATHQWVPQGLPYGAKARLIMLYLCTQAVLRQSAIVPIADTMTAFMRKLGIAATGGEHGSIARFKEQTNRLTASRMQFAMVYSEKRAVQFNPAPMIKRAELWFPDDPKQRVLWPSEVRLSQEFFEVLRRYALPVDPRAFGALAHSARALDLYTWLAHRLPRVKEHAGVFISWDALREQFGADVADLRNVRGQMLPALKLVLMVYPAAKVDQVPGGLKLFRSEPAIARKASVQGARVGRW